MVKLWAIIRQSRGRSLIFASKTKKNTRNHTISSVYLGAEVGFVGPGKNIVVSGTRHSSCPILLVFSLVALASPSTQAHSLRVMRASGKHWIAIDRLDRTGVRYKKTTKSRPLPSKATTLILNLRSFEQNGVNFVSRRRVHFGEDVGVGVQRDAHIRMS